ncbi:ribonuclease H-like domain-containing protein [Tsukamurella paurometabola]|uniref:Ribonuclease H-like domain-containing protein n=1 Tax=Tsukamurella paurometabola TaxID=2061 RepID=A0ABS5NG70_TSUPA|nr:ribonuclease H-like domain-containing protein [Tsukamurella paurometabola]MBS4102413.1 ribonuclease H-like domain-containing protein [Tsukamurella paurometabola]
MADGPRILVIDIEVMAGLAMVFQSNENHIGIDQIIQPTRIICFAAQWYGEKKMMFHSEWGDGYDDMILALWNLMDDADYVVGYNSTSYDVKYIQAAFLNAGMEPPSPHKNVDLMREIRRCFKSMSGKLDWWGRQLQIGKKVENGGIRLWKALAFPESPEEQAKAQRLMMVYNKQDVKLTVELYERLLPWLGSLNVALYADDPTERRCMNCGSTHLQSRGWAYTKVARYRQFACQQCGKWMRDKRAESVSEMRAV